MSVRVSAGAVDEASGWEHVRCFFVGCYCSVLYAGTRRLLGHVALGRRLNYTWWEDADHQDIFDNHMALDSVRADRYTDCGSKDRAQYASNGSLMVYLDIALKPFVLVSTTCLIAVGRV